MGDAVSEFRWARERSAVGEEGETGGGWTEGCRVHKKGEIRKGRRGGLMGNQKGMAEA